MVGDVIVHVGLHKTGTTFLQQMVFPKLMGVNFVNLTGTVRYDILGVDVKPGINLISREGLSGHPFEPDRALYFERDVIARNLKKVFPSARIIVGVRDKDAWVKSLYKQYFKMKPGGTFNGFMKVFDKRYLDFEGYISLLESLFSDVYVYHYENLKDDFDGFIDGIVDFVGVSRPSGITNVVYNRSLSDGQEKLLGGVYSFGLFGYRCLKFVLEKGNRRVAKR